MAEKKIVSKEVKLQAFALFTMAANHAAKSKEFEVALGELLGMEDTNYLGCLSDEILGSGDFEQAFKNEGFEVE